MDEDDAIICLLQKAHSALDRPNTTLRITLFDFSSAFKAGQPRLLQVKLEDVRVDSLLIAWITDYLLGGPQVVRLQNCV